MTLEGFRDPLPLTDPADRARAELEHLFARPQPAVTVLVKKRRWTGKAARGSDELAANTAATRTTPHDAAGGHVPRVHRLSAAGAGRHDEGDQGSDRPRDPLASTATPAPAVDVAPAAPPASPRRRRAARHPARRPSPVRIVMQAPSRPAVVYARPAWQRILCMAPPPVSYRQVMQSLEEVQALLAQARQAGALRFDASGR